MVANSNDDRFLQVNEIATQRLGAALMVLSVGETNAVRRWKAKG